MRRIDRLDLLSMLMLGVGIAAFLFATLVPIRLLDPFSLTDVETIGSGIRLAEPGLLLSDVDPSGLDGEHYRRGTFSMMLALRASGRHVEGPARIATYSRNSEVHNWLIGQLGDQLVVRHRGRQVRFHEAIPTDRSARMVLSFDRQHVTLYEPGRSPRRGLFIGKPLWWDLASRLALGNEVTGDRPWTGELVGLSLYDRPLDREEALELLAAGPDSGQRPPPEYRLESAPGGSPVLTGRAGDEIGLDAELWPLRHKIYRLSEPYSERRGSLQDVIQNILLTGPAGFALGLLLRRRSLLAATLVPLAIQGGLSLVVETLQFFSYERMADWVDLLTNSVGAVAGALIARMLVRLIGQQAPDTPGGVAR